MNPARETLTHIDLLRKVRRSGSVPAGIAAALRATEDAAVAALVAHGPWETADQLPERFLLGLLARPWHRTDQWPVSLSAAAALEPHAKALAAEAAALYGAARMRREHECLHVGGGWARFEPMAPWHTPGAVLPACAADAPAACTAIRAVRAASSAIVLRGGYSAVEPGTWIRPHHGVTNGQLKLHLGLVVPRTPQGSCCATLRVHNETRCGWSEGAITFFDDSFEHEVRSECDSVRIVFQLVIVHPDLPESPYTGAREAGYRLH